jgi:hypothetical protein
VGSLRPLQQNDCGDLKFFMVRNFHLKFLVITIAAFFPSLGIAQTSEWQPAAADVSLGDVARSLRTKKTPDPAPQTVIDNDSLSKVVEDAESQRQSGKPVFSVDSARNQFQMSSPDGSCSLSFSAEAASLVSTPYVTQDLPDIELAKLDGPATIHGKTLQVSVYNGSSWNVKEITVGLTIVRHDAPAPAASYYGSAKLIPASAGDNVSDSPGQNSEQSQKRPDSTVLYHLKGWAASQATTLFEENIDLPLDAGQEWHWAIVQARGTPPKPDATQASTIAVTPATPDVSPAAAAAAPEATGHQ